MTYKTESSKVNAVRGGLPRASGALVDLHCHCLPGFDDGPESYSQTVTLCRALTRHNIHTAVATPHQLGRFDGRTRPDEVRSAVQQLNQRLADEEIDLLVLPGAEVRLDERIGTLLSEDAILTLADLHRHILLELPRETFIDIEPLIVQLMDQGMGLVIAHPERNPRLFEQPDFLARWLTYGVALQVTAGSLTGGFGAATAQRAWGLLMRGWAAIVATDAHDCSPMSMCMRSAVKMITARLGRPAADLLCAGNPLRVLNGEDTVPVFGSERGGW